MSYNVKSNKNIHKIMKVSHKNVYYGYVYYGSFISRIQNIKDALNIEHTQ